MLWIKNFKQHTFPCASLSPLDVTLILLQITVDPYHPRPAQQDLRYGEPSLHSGAGSIVKDRNVPCRWMLSCLTHLEATTFTNRLPLSVRSSMRLVETQQTKVMVKSWWSHSFLNLLKFLCCLGVGASTLLSWCTMQNGQFIVAQLPKSGKHLPSMSLSSCSHSHLYA